MDQKIYNRDQKIFSMLLRALRKEASLTQQELAEMVGTTRETLAHTLADFRRRGLLDTSHHQVVIRDAERLAEVADREE